MLTPVNNEQKILAALAAGERKTTELIYQQNHHIVGGWIRKNGGSAADSADIFQEALVVLFGKAQSEDFRLTCSIGTYLFAICKHLWYKKLEKMDKSPITLSSNQVFEDENAGLHYEDDLKVHQEREVHYEQLSAALDQLGEPCRSLLRAYYHQEKNMQEIASEFGYTNPENAKNQKYKCLGRLRKVFYNLQAK